MVKNGTFTVSIVRKVSVKMKASIYSVRKELTKKGHPIVLDVSHKPAPNIRLSRRKKTIGHTAMRDWDEDRNVPLTTHPDYDYLYGKIIEIRQEVRKHRFTQMVDVDRAVALLLNESTVSDNVQAYGAQEVANLRARQKNGNADHVENCLKPWALFAPDLTFNQINRELINDFKRTHKGLLSDTTIKAYIGILRKIYNIALLDRHIVIDDDKAFAGCMSGLKVRMRRARNVYLDDKNLNKLIERRVKGDFEINNSEHLALDLTLLQFYLGGANFKDVCFLERKNLYKGRVLMHRSKLGDNAEYFDLKVFKAARKIFEKYEGEDPTYIFPWRKDAKGYKTFRDRHNKNLRSVQLKINLKLSPLNMPMSSNVIRHTFATRGKFLKIGEDVIRELMGHERDDIDTVYKDKYPEKMRDKAHKKIIKIAVAKK